MPLPCIHRLLVLTNPVHGNSQEMMAGIIAYGDQRGAIEYLYEADPNLINEHIIRLYPDAQAFLVEAMPHSLCNTLVATAKPVVIMHHHNIPGAHEVTCDDYAIGQMAFEHLHDLGVKNYALYPAVLEYATFAKLRIAGFMRAAARKGCHVYLSPDNTLLNNRGDQSRLEAWLESLPKPVGLFCLVAFWALRVIRGCHNIGIAVPDEVAVLGVDRDDLICNLATPKLSTIDTGAFRIGYEAAALAVRLLRGRRPPKKTLVIPPGEVIIRQSTDVLTIDDADVVAAARYIRRHACQGIQTREILDNIPVSRRSLEIKFKRVFGRTIHQEILRIRLREATRLLIGTNDSILNISLRCGFTSLSDFGRAFRCNTGQTPLKYRQSHRSLLLPDLPKNP